MSILKSVGSGQKLVLAKEADEANKYFRRMYGIFGPHVIVEEREDLNIVTARVLSSKAEKIIVNGCTLPCSIRFEDKPTLVLEEFYKPDDFVKIGNVLEVNSEWTDFRFYNSMFQDWDDYELPMQYVYTYPEKIAKSKIFFEKIAIGKDGLEKDMPVIIDKNYTNHLPFAHLAVMLLGNDNQVFIKLENGYEELNIDLAHALCHLYDMRLNEVLELRKQKAQEMSKACYDEKNTKGDSQLCQYLVQLVQDNI